MISGTSWSSRRMIRSFNISFFFFKRAICN